MAATVTSMIERAAAMVAASAAEVQRSTIRRIKNQSLLTHPPASDVARTGCHDAVSAVS
jgi:hypothetical protein